MEISLSDHFTYKRLLRFVLPTILTMIITSVYSIVDGYFVSNFVGKNAFAAVNIMIPFLILLSSVGFMVGEGGCALVSKTMGEGDSAKANRYFSMMVYIIAGFGFAVTVAGLIAMPWISELLGASEEILDDCVTYGRIAILSTGFFMLMVALQSFLITAEKPHLGLVFSICSGVTNIALDFVLVYLLKLGVGGAAAATALSETVGGLCPLIYFARENSSQLKLVLTRIELKPVVKACTNGASEMIGAVAASFVSVLYNLQLMKLASEDGVASFGVLMYVSSIFTAIFAGFCMGVTPVFGFNFGAQNHSELKNVLKKSLIITGITAVVMTAGANILSDGIADVFVGYDVKLHDMTCNAMRLFSICFLFCGFNALASSFFTGLNNGKVSMIMSFARTVVLELAAIIILPEILGINGIWLAMPVSEGVAIILAVALLLKYRKRYHY